MNKRIFSALIIFFAIFLYPGKADAGTAPAFSGYVKTRTGAPIAGAVITQMSHTTHNCWVSGTDENGNPTGSECMSYRDETQTTTSDQNGFYQFPSNSYFQCATNPQHFNVTIPNGSCREVLDRPGNLDISRKVDIICDVVEPTPTPVPTPTPTPIPACNQPCNNPNECAGNLEGCLECRPNAQGQNTCQPPPPPACNSFCSSNTDCTRNTEGCTQCVAGQCRIPPACNVTCIRDDQCAGARDGCTDCLPSDNGTGSVCRPPAACNVSCTRDDQCAGARDGCTTCGPSDSGTGKVCRPAPACNVSCTKDDQCAGARDGCTDCMDGICKPPPACGTACTTKAQCAGAKDGCSECFEGTCTDYSDNMCKCDGIVADIQYPSNAFKFEAFGKVEGADTKKAEIADITFRMTKDNQVIAKSNPITPQIAENSPTKMRFKAAWQTTPPQVDKNATYRVFADVRCKPKKIVASGGELAVASMVPVPEKVTSVESIKQFSVPKGTQLLANIINQFSRLFGRGSDLITKEALAQFSQTSPAPNQAGNQLQLQTLNFIKMLDTDNCRFVMWKFDETLF